MRDLFSMAVLSGFIAFMTAFGFPVLFAALGIDG